MLAKARTDISEGAVDTTTAPSFRFERMTGWDGYHKKIGTKISLFSDSKGLPADVLFGSGDTPDPDFLPEHRRNVTGRRCRILNLDKLYVSVKLRREIRNHGTKINMQMKTHDYKRKRGPKFRFDRLEYKTRFLVERLNGWLKNFRSIRIRRTYHPAMFKAAVYLALIIILIRYS